MAEPRDTIATIQTYYTEVARDAYDHWGGAVNGAIHYGFMEDPDVELFAEPELVPELHKQSLRRITEEVLEFMDLRETDTVLDLGCGVGSMLQPLSQRAGKVIGANIVPYHLEQARGRIEDQGLKNVQVIETDYHQIDAHVPDGADVAMFFETICYSYDMDVVLDALDRTINLVDGRIYAFDPMLTCDPDTLSEEDQALVASVNRGYALTLYSVDRLQGGFEERGFDVNVKDISRNVTPSINLAAASAKAHAGDTDITDEVKWHREGAIACAILAKKGILGYYLVGASRSREV